MGLTDEGMRALAQCESLTTVNIRDVEITGKGLEGWDSVAMPNIRSIVIDDRGGLSKEAVTRLVHGFPNGRVYLPKHTAWMREAQRNRSR